MDNSMEEALTYKSLPIIVADDDFIEHLREQGFSEIELDELFLEYEDWAAENVL